MDHQVPIHLLVAVRVVMAKEQGSVITVCFMVVTNIRGVEPCEEIAEIYGFELLVLLRLFWTILMRRALKKWLAFFIGFLMNWDIYISTPNINKIHKEIRAVAEFGYRHKNMATVFSFMKGRYKRVTHIADNSGTA